MTILGAVLLVLGLLFQIPLLVWIGAVVLVIGLVLLVASSTSGRRNYW